MFRYATVVCVVIISRSSSNMSQCHTDPSHSLGHLININEWAPTPYLRKGCRIYKPQSQPDTWERSTWGEQCCERWVPTRGRGYLLSCSAGRDAPQCPAAVSQSANKLATQNLSRGNRRNNNTDYYVTIQFRRFQFSMLNKNYEGGQKYVTVIALWWVASVAHVFPPLCVE